MYQPAKYSPQTAAVIGNGMFASLCTKFLIEHFPKIRITCLYVDVSPRKFGSGLEVLGRHRKIPFRFVSTTLQRDAVEDLIENPPHFLFSLSNSILIPKEVLDACGLAINFHNSPLPSYAGFHSCSWAIFHGAETYGVTFHKMEAQVDGGDILFQECFSLPDAITAGTLVADCFMRGIRLFKENLHKILEGTLEFKPQDLSRRSLYRSGEIPNLGWLDASRPANDIWKLYRAYSYLPLSSPLGCLKIRVGEKCFFVERLLRTGTPSSQRAGTCFIQGSNIVVHSQDEVLQLTCTQVEDNAQPWNPKLFTGN